MDHGEACAVMLLYYVAYYAPTVTDKPKTLTNILGVEHEPGGGITAAWNSKRKMGVKFIHDKRYWAYRDCGQRDRKESCNYY